MDAVGIDPDRVEFVAIGQPTLRAQALAAGQIDATTMSIGVWMAMPDQTGLPMLIDQTTYYAAAPVVNKVNVVTDEVLAARRDDVAAVVRALVKASRDFAADQDPGSTRWRRRGRTSTARRSRAARLFAGSWSVNGGLNREELEATAAWTFGGADSPASADRHRGLGRLRLRRRGARGRRGRARQRPAGLLIERAPRWRPRPGARYRRGWRMP